MAQMMPVFSLSLPLWFHKSGSQGEINPTCCPIETVNKRRTILKLR